MIKMFVFEESYLDIVCVVQVALYLYFYFERIKTISGGEINKKKKNNNKKTSADTMCGNKLLPVNRKACVPHCQILIK